MGTMPKIPALHPPTARSEAERQLRRLASLAAAVSQIVDTDAVVVENYGCTRAMPERIRTLAAKDLFTKRAAPTNFWNEILL